MALATRCPHCGKMFRVASDQLKLRGGIVRCGACHEIFDGSAHLVDLDAPAAQAPAPASGPAHESPESQQNLSPSPEPSAEDVPVYTLDFDHAFDPLGILPKPVDAPTDSDEHAAAGPEPVVSEPGQVASAEHAVSGAEHGVTDAEHAVAEAEHGVADAPHVIPDTGHAAVAEAGHAVPEPEPVIPEPEPVAPEPEPFEPEPEPFAPEPEPAEPEPEPLAAPLASYAPHGDRIEPTLAFPVDEELVAAPLPGDEHEEHAAHHAVPPPPRPAAGAPLPMREAAGVEVGSQATRPARPRVAEARTGRRSKLTPSKIPAPKLRVPEIDEPEFVKRSRRQEQSGKSLRILMAVGSLVLLLALAVQLVIGARNELAARFPQARPALEGACKLFGCRVELPARIENLVIETGELTTLGANTYSLGTLLRNQGSLVQAWPHIELVLTDANDKPLLRRVFTPAEYLPQGASPAAGFAARAEQPVKLYFQLDQLKPSGYRIAVFYP